jgi:6-phosphogluconolactonase (cycloisomerase 2 family)
VLNQYAPTTYEEVNGSGPCVTVPSETCPGTIAIYSIGPKGVLSPVPNTLNTSGPTIYYWNVGFLPLQMYAGGGSVFTVDNASSGTYTQGSSDIYIWNVAPSGGGFTQPSVQSVACPGCDLVALTGNGSYLYAVDYNSGDVYGYQMGNSGLSALVGSPYPVCHGTTTTTPCTNIGPNYLSIDPSGKYLYITSTKVNPPSSTNPNPSSTVYAFFFPSTGTNAGVITFIDGFGVGPNPQCISISTGTEYLYTANYNDGTATGYQVATINGTLRTILGGPATQTTAGQANCLVFSSRI